MFGPDTKISYKSIIDGKKDSKEFPVVDHFGGETQVNKKKIF